MDFMKWLSSLDELLYEIVSWLVFFPVTLWRSVTRPLAMMTYAENQLSLPDSEQYGDAVSPPLFLALALVLAHLGAVAMGAVDTIVASHKGLASMIHDDTSALLFRLLVFAVFPLAMSIRLLRVRRTSLNRQTLRLPFYAQCYPASVFALGLSFGTLLANARDPVEQAAGFALSIAVVIFYLAVETRWFAIQGRISALRAFGSAIRAFGEGCVTLILAASLIAR